MKTKSFRFIIIFLILILTLTGCSNLFVRKFESKDDEREFLNKVVEKYQPSNYDESKFKAEDSRAQFNIDGKDVTLNLMSIKYGDDYSIKLSHDENTFELRFVDDQLYVWDTNTWYFLEETDLDQINYFETFELDLSFNEDLVDKGWTYKGVEVCSPYSRCHTFEFTSELGFATYWFNPVTYEIDDLEISSDDAHFKLYYTYSPSKIEVPENPQPADINKVNQSLTDLVGI